MKYKGRLTAFILVLISNLVYIAYYSLNDGSISIIEIIGLPIMLVMAWLCGKQYDRVKFFVKKIELESKELARRNELFQTIFETAPIGIALIDKNGKPVISNHKLQEMLGYTDIEFSRMTFGDFSHPDDTVINMKLLNELLEGQIDHYVLEKRYFRKDGQLVWGNVTSSLFPNQNDDSFYIIGMINDITERKIAEQQLREAYQEMETLSNRDGLTGIANRRYFDDYFVREYERSVRYLSPFSLILLDIDFFKEYNDQYGHVKGDECLKQVARTLERTANDFNKFVARYGGEEFVVILPGTDMIEATIMAEKIRSSVEKLNILHAGSTISNYLTVTLGVSTLMTDFKVSPENFINQADKALYQAKQKGRNRVEIYHNEIFESILISNNKAAEHT